MSATLASKSIFEAFLSDKKVDALLHGHSYTANPVGCAVALKAIEMVESHEAKGGWRGERDMWLKSKGAGVRVRQQERQQEQQLPREGGRQEGVVEIHDDDQRWSFWSPDFVKRMSEMKDVEGVMALGTVCAIELKDEQGGEFLSDWKKEGVKEEFESETMEEQAS